MVNLNNSLSLLRGFFIDGCIIYIVVKRSGYKPRNNFVICSHICPVQNIQACLYTIIVFYTLKQCQEICIIDTTTAL